MVFRSNTPRHLLVGVDAVEADRAAVAVILDDEDRRELYRRALESSSVRIAEQHGLDVERWMSLRQMLKTTINVIGIPSEMNYLFKAIVVIAVCLLQSPKARALLTPRRRSHAAPKVVTA